MDNKCQKYKVSYRACPPKTTLGGPPVPPTPDQRALLDEVRARLPDLFRQAIANIPDLPAGLRPEIPFDRDAIDLQEIRLEADGNVELFFGPCLTVEEQEVYPLVVFHQWRIVEAYWTT